MREGYRLVEFKIKRDSDREWERWRMELRAMERSTWKGIEIEVEEWRKEEEEGDEEGEEEEEEEEVEEGEE